MYGKKELDKVLLQMINELCEIRHNIKIASVPQNKQEQFDNVLEDLVSSFQNAMLDCRQYKKVIDKAINSVNKHSNTVPHIYGFEMLHSTDYSEGEEEEEDDHPL